MTYDRKATIEELRASERREHVAASDLQEARIAGYDVEGPARELRAEQAIQARLSARLSQR